MNDGQPAQSGELSSFLHLTGWRPLILALVAGLAGAYGLFLALNAPAEWQARYVLNASRVADDDFSPQELDIFVEEIAQTARFPQVENAVEDRLGLENEVDYEIQVGQSAQSAQFVDINVVSGDPDNARAVAIETGIEALSLTLNDILGGLVATADQIQSQIDQDEARITELTVEAGGFTPTVAYDIAVQEVIQRRLDIANPPTEPCTLADGTQGQCEIELSGPTLEELEAESARLAPIQREFTTVDADIQAARNQLAVRNDSIRDTRAALSAVESERENQLILDEVITEETSRIAGLLSGLLLFAIPAALIMIVLFTVYDLLRPKPPVVEAPSSDLFDAAGVLEAMRSQALPEGSVTPLVVVDEDENEAEEQEAEDDEDDGDDESDESDIDDDPDPPGSRWGRDPGSKAG